MPLSDEKQAAAFRINTKYCFYSTLYPNIAETCNIKVSFTNACGTMHEAMKINIDIIM